MKIKITDIESKIDYKLKRNFTSVGFDTAQISGIVFLKTDNEYIHIDSLVLSFKTKNQKEIYESMVKTFDRIFNKEDLAIVEEVFVGFSRAGSVELAKYGSFAISACIRKEIPYETISAVSARSKFKIDTRKFGKGKSKEAVAEWTKSLGVNLLDNNAVDGFVLALIGLCDGMDFRSQTEIKKANTKKKSAKKYARRKRCVKK